MAIERLGEGPFVVAVVMEPDYSSITGEDPIIEEPEFIQKYDDPYGRCACCGSKITWRVIVEARAQGVYYCLGRTCAVKAGKVEGGPVIEGLTEKLQEAKRRERDQKVAKERGFWDGYDNALRAFNSAYDDEPEHLEELRSTADGVLASQFAKSCGKHSDLYGRAAVKGVRFIVEMVDGAEVPESEERFVAARVSKNDGEHFVAGIYDREKRAWDWLEGACTGEKLMGKLGETAKIRNQRHRQNLRWAEKRAAKA